MHRILLAALLMTLASPAFAHAHLLSEVPAAKASLAAAPTTLTLKFSEAIELAFTGVTVTAADGKAVALGTAGLDPRDPEVLIVPIIGALGSGSYTVAWHALSTDGHRTTGTYSFSVN